MPISEGFFELVKGLSLEDLLELATIIPVLVRARLAGVSLSWQDVQYSSLSGSQREAVRTGRLAEPISSASTSLNDLVLAVLVYFFLSIVQHGSFL